MESLKDIIGFNGNFKTAINLYLSVNKPDKVLGYIPTKSSVALLDDYMKSVIDNKEQATLLVGPYGKGKSHLLLVLLAILSMKRNDDNLEVIEMLIDKIRSIDETCNIVSEHISKIWKEKRFLPVLISGSSGDLNQAFLYGINDALKRNELLDLVPDTFYSVALDRIADWESSYVDTYVAFERELLAKGITMSSLMTDLKHCSRSALDIFSEIYPKVTAGTAFNPMAVSDVLPLYKSISERLVEEYGYSGIYIIFDEFSKFIEGQDGIAVGTNMKLLQDVCELSTDSQHAQVFFTMVAHKSIKEYGKYLSSEIINSFTGIEGRIIEKYFVTSSKNNYELIKNAIIKKTDKLETMPHFERLLGQQALRNYYQLPAFKSKFQENDFESIVLKGCYPLNPIAAYLLLNVSEKVAQNERTLFTFISNDEPNSMFRFVQNHNAEMPWNIGADLIYDYFAPLLKKEVANEYVHNIWLSTEYTLEKCETDEQRRIAKALAAILIVNKADELPANEKYLSLCVGADDALQATNELLTKQLIYKKSATETYVFKTQAGSELKSEIRRQREIKGENVNYSKVLQDVTGRYYVIPRRYNTVHMMTRYFTNEFMEVNDFLNIGSAEALLSECTGDGKVITLYSFYGIKQEVVKKHVESLACSQLVVVCPKKGLKSTKQMRDYEIVQDIRFNQTFTSNNEIVKKEIPLLLEDITSEIENTISSIYDEDKDTRVLYFDGQKVKNARMGGEEDAVNLCCELVYSKTPVINNEMVNRSVIGTVQTQKARLNIIQAILTHEDSEEFYAGSNQEATVYRSLFCQTGLLNGTQSRELTEIVSEINTYVDSCSDTKVPVAQLIKKLTSSPYGMRAGVIPIYVAYVLTNHREDIIVYYAEKEIQLSADIIVSMCEQAEDYALYVSREDLQKEKYISKLNVLFQVEDNRNLSANRIKNIYICMQRWFRALPQASRNAINLENYVDETILEAMKAIKNAMQKVEFNPFEILFVKFSEDFGTTNLEETFAVIKKCKEQFDEYYDWIQAEAVNRIYEIYGGKRKQDLFHLLSDWYDKQSVRSKQGLHNGRITNYMSCIQNMNVYHDADIARKVVKAVSDVYMENWNVGALEEFAESLANLKKEIELINGEVTAGSEMRLEFTGKNGEVISKLYSHADEGTGSVLRNILEDTLDEYDDLSVNDRVSILLEMIEKIIK